MCSTLYLHGWQRNEAVAKVICDKNSSVLTEMKENEVEKFEQNEKNVSYIESEITKLQILFASFCR